MFDDGLVGGFGRLVFIDVRGCDDFRDRDAEAVVGDLVGVGVLVFDGDAGVGHADTSPAMNASTTAMMRMTVPIPKMIRSA